MNMSEEQVLEEIYNDLNEEEDLIMKASMEENWSDDAEDDDDKKKNHALRSNVYIKDKEVLIKR